MIDQVTAPYLSVVAVSRNDDHGGDPLRRTQVFINSLAWQAQRYALATELVLVDWNPPEGRAGLAEALEFPVNAYFCARVIVVPPAVHAGFRHGDRLPLFQMIGKNVGIRRAHGEFVLATNIDILLDDALFEALACRELDPKRMYRADRFDVANTLPDEGHEARQAFCRNKDNLIRRNQRQHPEAYRSMQDKDGYASSGLLRTDLARKLPWAELDRSLTVPCVRTAQNVPLEYLHTNGCGDFTLLHRNAWAELHGYGEFETFSMHIDSIGCIQAQVAGYRETCFLPPLVCYHIEHAPASGWTPEGGRTLFERIREAGIPLFEWEVVKVTLISMMDNEVFFVLNDDHWGLRDIELEEKAFGGAIQEKVIIEGTRPSRFMRLAAIKQQYEHGILFQNFFAQDIETGYVYLRRLTAHPLWRLVHLGIVICYSIRKGLNLVMPRLYSKK